MKSKISLLLIVFLITVSHVNAQDCPMYFPDQVGTVREIRTFDQRDRLSSIARQEVLDKVISGNRTEVKVRSSTYDNNEKEIYTGELEIVCEDGVFTFDLKDYLDPNTMAAYEEMGVEITADNLVYPANLKTGDQLPDGEIKMVVKSGQTTILTIAVTISNRKVEGIENITTDAGTFACYKISYGLTSKAGFISTNLTAVEWVADGIGMVRNESYDRRGRLNGYSVLSDLKN